MLVSFGYSQKINWMTFDEAMEAQKTNPKKILVDIYAKWCGPCKMMSENTFTQPQIVKYINDNYYAVKFDAEGNEKVHYQGQVFTNPNYNPNISSRGEVHEFPRFLNIVGFPTLAFIDEKGEFITTIVGYFEPKDLEPYLEFFGTNQYKKIKTKAKWEEYLRKFNSKLKK